MLRIIRGIDCYWMIGQRRVARVPLSGIMDWQFFDRQTQYVRAMDQVASADSYLLPVTIIVCAGSDFDVAAVLTACEHSARERGADGLDITLQCDQLGHHLDGCLRLLAGASRIGPLSASVIIAASGLAPTAVISLERVGVRYAQVTLDGQVMYSDPTIERDVTNLEQPATSTSLLWHARISLINDTVGTADTLLKVLAERLTPPSIDISFAFSDDLMAGFAEGGQLSHDLGDCISELYLHALTAGFNVRLLSCHRYAMRDSQGGGPVLILNADGAPSDHGQSLCACAGPDQAWPDQDKLTDAVWSALLGRLYGLCGLEQPC